MNTKEFIFMQLKRAKPIRVIPDLKYMQSGRWEDLHSLREGRWPVNADDVFNSSVFYENAAYFGPDGVGRLRYYLNGVL